MTTIAFDGKTIAADCQSTYGSFPVKAHKLIRLSYKGKRAIAGCAGTIQEFDPIIDWIKGGCKKKQRPDIEDEKPDFSIMVVTEDGEVHYACNSMFFHEMGKTKWAIGSGADYALGAMEAGLTAKKAVEVACRLDINSGLGIDVLKLPEPGKSIFEQDD